MELTADRVLSISVGGSSLFNDCEVAIMRQYPSDIAFTSTVKAFQTEKGSRMSYLDMEHRGGWQTTVTSDLKSFLIELDMFYHRAIAGSHQGS